MFLNYPLLSLLVKKLYYCKHNKCYVTCKSSGTRDEISCVCFSNHEKCSLNTTNSSKIILMSMATIYVSCYFV